jgi:hypothetical protein
MPDNRKRMIQTHPCGDRAHPRSSDGGRSLYPGGAFAGRARSPRVFFRCFADVPRGRIPRCGEGLRPGPGAARRAPAEGALRPLVPGVVVDAAELPSRSLNLCRVLARGCPAGHAAGAGSRRPCRCRSSSRRGRRALRCWRGILPRADGTAWKLNSQTPEGGAAGRPGPQGGCPGQSDR